MHLYKILKKPEHSSQTLQEKFVVAENYYAAEKQYPECKVRLIQKDIEILNCL